MRLSIRDRRPLKRLAVHQQLAQSELICRLLFCSASFSVEFAANMECWGLLWGVMHICGLLCEVVEWHGASSPAGVSLSDQIAPGHHAYGPNFELASTALPARVLNRLFDKQVKWSFKVDYSVHDIVSNLYQIRLAVHQQLAQSELICRLLFCSASFSVEFAANMECWGLLWSVMHICGLLCVVEWHGASSPAGVSLSDQIAPGHHAYGVAKLRVGFYSSTCPRAEQIVRQAVMQRLSTDRSITPALLRMHFHDCFVKRMIGLFVVDSEDGGN
ncbi:hypothetical protein TEA_008031 [Camellia sinensis var. sinensis]|uniref:peroxidase n=1 Tax=Camellia sinensis var. sinensis TaxID=542762 RepID=A0A4S4DP49_CAMSN|nr:hypothetical protein TEA_008031 [Camellia sinensis var. sinensis]